MTRNNKTKAEYFTHDADMRNDVKVKALRRRFSHKGYAVWCFTLEILTDSDDFETPFDELDCELYAADFDVTSDELAEIIGYCLRIGLLQRNEDGMVYSETLKERFESLLSRRGKLSEAGRMGANRRWSKDGEEDIAPDNEAITSDSEAIATDSKEEKRREKKKRVRDDDDVYYPLQEIVDLWNSICVSLPKVIKLNETRRKKMKARLSEWGTSDTWLPMAETLFKRIQASSFLCGASSQGWTATFDWLFESPSNWIKVSEGNYDDNRGANKAPQSPSAPQDDKLGVGEFRDATGRRTYGTGRYIIPEDAPPRPSDKHCWNASNNDWVLL